MKLIFDVLPVDRELGRAPVVEAAPYPVPVVSSRDGVGPALWPSSLVTMRGFASMHAWAWQQQYSRGCMPHATLGRPGPVKNWYGLRLSNCAGRAAWMVHDGGEWKSMAIWGTGVQPLVGTFGVTAMQSWIAGDFGMAGALGFRDQLAATMRESVIRKREQGKASAARRGSAGSGEAL